MSRKIKEMIILNSQNIEDSTNHGICFPGLNTKIAQAIKEGFEPYGELKVVFSERYTLPGSYATAGGDAIYIREFVKYEEDINKS